MCTAKIPAAADPDSSTAPAVAPSNRAVPDPWPAGVSPAVRRRKPLLSLRIDRDVLEWFRTQGPGYQTRMNAVLHAYMEHATPATARS